MAHYAELDSNNIVIRVIVVSDANEPTEADGIKFCEDLLGGRWVKTSYNTRGGVHYSNKTLEPSGQPHFRYNYGGPGFRYDAERDAFIPPSPYPSWILDEQTCTWKSPIDPPEAQEVPYTWNEDTRSWETVPPRV